MQSLWQKLERFSLALTPAALTVLMILLTSVPLHIPGVAQLMPLLALISIYYWNNFSPGMLPYAFLMLLGLLEDTLRGTPLGISSVAYILFALLVTREHKNFGKAKFGALWFGFALLSLVVVLLQWVIMSFYSGSLLPLEAHVLQWLATCLAYPPMHIFFSRVHRTLVE